MRQRKQFYTEAKRAKSFDHFIIYDLCNRNVSLHIPIFMCFYFIFDSVWYQIRLILE